MSKTSRIDCINPDLIYALYWGKNKSISEIAKIYGHCQTSIFNLMVKYKIPRRSVADANEIASKKLDKREKHRINRLGKPSPAFGKTWTQLPSSSTKTNKKFGADNNNWKGGVSSDPEHLRQQRRNHKAIRRNKSPHMPAWADKIAIAAIYKSAKNSGKTVDHIVPLKHRLVCGLHCEDNLRIISAYENRRKGNTFSIECAVHDRDVAAAQVILATARNAGFAGGGRNKPDDKGESPENMAVCEAGKAQFTRPQGRGQRTPISGARS